MIRHLVENTEIAVVVEKVFTSGCGFFFLFSFPALPASSYERRFTQPDRTLC